MNQGSVSFLQLSRGPTSHLSWTHSPHQIKECHCYLNSLQVHVASCHVLVSNTNFLLEITYAYTFREVLIYLERLLSLHFLFVNHLFTDRDCIENFFFIVRQFFRRYKLPKFAPIGRIFMLSESLPIPYIVDYGPFTIRKTVNVFFQCFGAHKLIVNLKVYIYIHNENQKTYILDLSHGASTFLNKFLVKLIVKNI